MKSVPKIIFILIFAISLTFNFTDTHKAYAHCDGLDGPVVKAAKKALETENVNYILIWVQKKDETEIRNAFQKTLSVRKLNNDAKELADMYFFETVVRLHRAGEGAPYTGLKPAGRDLGPAIPAADDAIESGSGEKLVKLLNESMHNGLHGLFQKVLSTKKFDKDDVEAGRKYIESYVIFIHYVENLYESTKKSLHGHFEESEDKMHKDEH